jgi:hypothetical protein
MRSTLALVALIALAAGCARPERADAGADAPRPVDAPSADAGLDARALDAPTATDTGTDARVTVEAPDAARDGGLDAGRDTGGASTDAGSDAGGTDAGTGILACAPEVPPGASAGLVCSAMFWPGFQFQVTTATRLLAVGVQGHSDGPAGSVHASVYRLTAMGAAPNLADPGALLARTLISLPGGSASPVVAAPVDAAVGPGWYALVVGTGAHGASATSATIPSGGDRGCVSAPGSGFPFSIRQSDGMLILQAAMPHLFVVLE